MLLHGSLLKESAVRTPDPSFNPIDGLFAKAGAMLGAPGAPAAAPDRLGHESLMSFKQLPDRLGRVLHRLRTEGLELSIKHRGREQLSGEVRGSGRRISLGLVTLGLYTGSSLLLQGSAGPHGGDTPVLALLGYAVALWLNWSLRRGRSPRAI